jgi:ABC-type glutathione transport system ATPase component
MSSPAKPILQLRDLQVSYGKARVVNGLNLLVRRGETAAIVGESGSGKSQTVLAALRLLPRQAVTSGSVTFEDTELLALSQRRLNALLGGASRWFSKSQCWRSILYLRWALRSARSCVSRLACGAARPRHAQKSF